jgi:DNA-directed RNA polymerase specialized sigma24 family protein
MTTPAKPGPSRKPGPRGRTATRADATEPSQPETPAPEPATPEAAEAAEHPADAAQQTPTPTRRPIPVPEPPAPKPPAPKPKPPTPKPKPPAPVGFDELHARTATRLAQQAYLLTGSRQRAAHCVDRAFELAWTHWPEVSADASPEGWLRATTFDLALSPWHGSHRRLLAGLLRSDRLRTRLRTRLQARVRSQAPAERIAAERIDPQGLTEQDQELVLALLRLPRGHRRVLVLHDVVGLDWKQTSTEAESTTPAAYARTVRARQAMAEAAPGIVGADPLARGFGRRLGSLLRDAAGRGCPAAGQPERTGALRHRSLLRERAATGVAGLAALATAVALLAGALLGTPFHPPAAPFVTYGSLHGKRQAPPTPQPVSAPRPSGSAAPAVGLGAARPTAAERGLPRTGVVRGGAARPAGGREGPESGRSDRQPISSRASRAVSDGVLPTLTPAASRASFLAWAVPEEPETMAPAWPMVLPSGAVKPAT